MDFYFIFIFSSGREGGREGEPLFPYDMIRYDLYHMEGGGHRVCV